MSDDALLTPDDLMARAVARALATAPEPTPDQVDAIADALLAISERIDAAPVEVAA